MINGKNNNSKKENKRMLKFKICYCGEYEDYIIIEGETKEECRQIAIVECNKRGWKEENCWTENV
jgi:hypothetical protein